MKGPLGCPNLGDLVEHFLPVVHSKADPNAESMLTSVVYPSFPLFSKVHPKGVETIAVREAVGVYVESTLNSKPGFSEDPMDRTGA